MRGVLQSLRFLVSDLIGIDDSAPPSLPDEVPAAVRPIVADAIALLVDYQGPGYARLYVDRLHRFSRRREVSAELLDDIARLMAQRMSYEDPIRIAQCKLAGMTRGVASAATDEIRRFRLDELVTALPGPIGRPVLACLGRTGRIHATVAIRFSTASRWGRRRLKLEAGLRRWRLFSMRYARERVWVERWLHMIDRALVKQPAAAAAIADTATMIQGSGEAYRRALADWHSIIDGLVKPALDGALPLPNLAGAVAEARAASSLDPAGESVKTAVLAIRARASSGGA